MFGRRVVVVVEVVVVVPPAAVGAVVKVDEVDGIGLGELPGELPGDDDDDDDDDDVEADELGMAEYLFMKRSTIWGECDATRECVWEA